MRRLVLLAGAYLLAVTASAVSNYRSELDKLERGIFTDTFDPYLLTWLLTLPTSLITGSIVAPSFPPTPQELRTRGLLLLTGAVLQAGAVTALARVALGRRASTRGRAGTPAVPTAPKRWAWAALAVLAAPGVLFAAITLLTPACPTDPALEQEVQRVDLHRQAPPGARRVHLEETAPCADELEDGEAVVAEGTYTAPGSYREVVAFYRQQARAQGWRRARPAEDGEEGHPALGEEFCAVKPLTDTTAVLLRVDDHTRPNFRGERLYTVELALLASAPRSCAVGVQKGSRRERDNERCGLDAFGDCTCWSWWSSRPCSRYSSRSPRGTPE